MRISVRHGSIRLSIKVYTAEYKKNRHAYLYLRQMWRVVR